jgi:hypothetical protein
LGLVGVGVGVVVFDVLFYISEFHFLFLLIFILFSLSSGDGSFFSLTRVLTVGKYAGHNFRSLLW